MRLKFPLKLWLPLIIAITGILIGYQILAADHARPTGKKRNKAKQVRIVQTQQLIKSDVIPYWDTSGFVSAAESVQVYAKVSGNIEFINPKAVPGGELQQGDLLVKLDPEDHQIAVEIQQATLAQTKASLELEQADQLLAKAELVMLEEQDKHSLDERLVLREPQLTMSRSKVLVANSNLQKARLNLARTQVMMPFSGKIINRNIGRGSKVSTGTALFSVVNTDKYWLEVKIPHQFLPLLDQHKMADLSQLRLWGEGKLRHAKFVSVLPELDTKDRQVKLLLEIDQPLTHGEHSPAVFLNDFVNVRLKGKAIKDAWVIQHHWLQADNSIWVVDADNLLQKRAVEVLFKGRDVIYVDAQLKQGDLALSEKPGIASAGLRVRTKRSIAKQHLQDKSFNQVSVSMTKSPVVESKDALKSAHRKGVNNDV